MTTSVPPGAGPGAPERTPVSRGWITRYGLLFFGQHLSWAAPAQILIAVQVL